MPIRYFSTALIPLLFSPLLSAQPPADSPVFNTATRVVNVNVVAKNKHGKPVDDLSRTFSWLDRSEKDGIQQR